MNYIALDIGNVLCTVYTQPFIEYLSETFNVPLHEAQYFLKRFQRIHDLGYTTMEDELKEKFGARSQITIKKIVQAWNDSVVPYEPILDIFNDMRLRHGLKVALLSNIGVEHAEMMKEKLKHDGFLADSVKHFSCDVGARKPSSIYYQSFLLQYPNFQGCLYIDDLDENLEVGAKFGFKPFKFDLTGPDVNQKIYEIEQLIINTPKPKNSRRH